MQLNLDLARGSLNDHALSDLPGCLQCSLLPSVAYLGFVALRDRRTSLRTTHEGALAAATERLRFGQPLCGAHGVQISSQRT